MSRRRTSDTLPFDTLRLEGSLFVPELLERAARGGATAQKETDYDIPKGLKLHDEYGRAFRIAGALWQDFAAQRPRADLNATTFTRRFVIDFLRQTLGYDDLVALGEPVVIGDRGFPVTAQALGGRLPVIIAPHHLGLDDPDPTFAIQGSGAKKKSAHQLAQEYLNATPAALWAIVSNGRSLRLLRDAETLTRPNFLEFDLETILGEGEDRYADYSALWRLLHASRSGDRHAPSSSPADCIWEQWKGEGHAQGLRVREGLRVGVTQALLVLGSGFVAHPDNKIFRDRLGDGTLTTDAFFQQLLRLVYRWLFLFCAEERELLHAPLPDDPQQAESARSAREAYARGYGLRRLRSRSLRRLAHNPHGDLWISLQIAFRSLASGEPRLALPALGGLFADSQCPDIDAAALSNRDLLAAMRELRWFFDKKSGRRSAIDYRNMGPEELGSVYESLLELIPTLDLAARSFEFVGRADDSSTAGNERKTTGSYYTPDALVQELIKSALDPVIAKKIADNPSDPIAALLSLTVVDPACGSGHFLIAAARRLAERLAELRAPDGAVRPDDYLHALREVISHCIYGVDRNPMALELARTALWLEGYEPGQPLSFLDHHLQCGDALLGLTSFDQLRKGIANDAFTALSGDHKEICKDLSATNREAVKVLKKRLKDKSAELFDASDLDDALQRLEAIEAMPDGSTAEVETKKTAFTRFLADARTSRLAHACDLLVAAYLTPKTPETARICPTTGTLLDVLFPQQGKPAPQAVIDHASERCRRARVFHWPLRFAHIFGHGGFDCVLGNPPWEVSQLGEEEYFAAREPNIAALAGAKRKAAISELENANPRLWEDYLADKRRSESSNTYFRTSDRFPLTAVGKLNTYPLFAETISQITSESGRAGFIIPTGIATDDSTKLFFQTLIRKQKLAQLVSFYEVRLWFKATDERKPFCLFTLGSCQTPKFIFDVITIDELLLEEKWYELSKNDFQLLNPNTHTLPTFRAKADSELTKKVYRRVPILIEEATGESPTTNPWGITFSQGLFNMTSASHLFLDAPELDSLPLYEAKMIHQFDHRWAHFRNQKRNKRDELVTEDSTDDEKSNPGYRITPRYWVPEREVLAKIARAPKCVRDTFRDQDPEALLSALAIWIESRHETDLLGGMTRTTARQRVLQLGGSKFDALPTDEKDWINDKALAETRDWQPLTDDEIDLLRDASDVTAATHQLLDQRSPRWLMGWRDVTNAAAERTVIASVLPRAAFGHTLPLFISTATHQLLAAALANWNSLVLDFISRQKVGGTHLTYGYLKQLPILPPSTYNEADLAFIVPRVLELTYTADDLSGWARDLGHDGPPFRFDPHRRALLRAELDAWFARLYGLTREELQYILDPASTHGPDYPTVTFPGLKKNEIAKYGEYRTQRLVLEAWDRLFENLSSYVCQGPSGSGSGHGEKGKLPLLYFALPEERRVSLEGKSGNGLFYARASQAERVTERNEESRGSFWKLEAFSKTWFDSNPPPDSDPTWQDEGSFISYYSRAEIFMLELELILPHLEAFEALRSIQDAASEESEPSEWFLVRAGRQRGDSPIEEVIPLSVFPSLYQAGASLTLDRIEPVDDKTRDLLNQAVSTRHIADAKEEDLERILRGALSVRIDWSVVYDVGQGNCIGLCNTFGGPRAYFDFGGGILQNSITFPPALQSFCFTRRPPIILSHWDGDHWSSANRDPRALGTDWIVPRQSLTPGPAALLASIANAKGRVWFLPPNFGGQWFSQVFLELCTGKNRNNSGIALTLSEEPCGGGKRILMPGDADYHYIGSYTGGSPYLSVVASHHGGVLRKTTKIPGNPGDQASRLVYSAGPNNSYEHPLHESRQAHDAVGWRDLGVSPSIPHDVRETSHRGHSGLGHVFLGWQVPANLPTMPCGGVHCQLHAQQS